MIFETNTHLNKFDMYTLLVFKGLLQDIINGKRNENQSYDTC